MKFLLLISFLVTLSVQSLAQRDPDKLRYALKVEKFRKMKTTGAKNTLNGAESNGLLVYLLGVGSLGAGIPLWIVGGHQQRKYERRFESVSVGFNLTPQNTGLTLRYRF